LGYPAAGCRVRRPESTENGTKTGGNRKGLTQRTEIKGIGMKKRGIRAKYLRLTEEMNALDYLEKAYFFIQQTENDVYAWKWVILSLFGALYGFAICACRGTSNLLVTYKTKSGQERLIGFRTAIRYCQDPNIMGQYVFSRELQLTKRQEDSIKRMHEVFRNQFEHYIPKLWSIEVHGWPQMAIDVLEVIRFLAIDTGNILFRLKSSQVRKIKSCVYQSKRILKNSKLYEEYKLHTSRKIE